MEEFIGAIKMFAGNYAPVGWLLCYGQQLRINQYQTLFYILGTKYGGDGKETFNLPDFRDRIPIGEGANFPIGTRSGESTKLLTKENLPTLSGGALMYNLTGVANGVITGNSTVNISIPCNDSPGATTPNPANNYIATSNALNIDQGLANMYNPIANSYLKSFSANVPINVTANIPVKLNSTVAEVNINTNPSPKPISNMQPVLAISYIICYEGIFPVRAD